MFILTYGPFSENSEEEIEGFWNESNKCVERFGRNESIGGNAWGFKRLSGK